MNDIEDDECLSKGRSAISSSTSLPSSSSSKFSTPEQRDEEACDQPKALPVGKARRDFKCARQSA